MEIYLIGKSFRSLPRVMLRDSHAFYQTRKSQSSLNHKHFASQFEHWLKHDGLCVDYSIIASQVLSFNKFFTSMVMVAAGMDT